MGSLLLSLNEDCEHADPKSNYSLCAGSTSSCGGSGGQELFPQRCLCITVILVCAAHDVDTLTRAVLCSAHDVGDSSSFGLAVVG